MEPIDVINDEYQCLDVNGLYWAARVLREGRREYVVLEKTLGPISRDVIDRLQAYVDWLLPGQPAGLAVADLVRLIVTSVEPS